MLLRRYQALFVPPVPPLEGGGVSRFDDGRRRRSATCSEVPVWEILSCYRTRSKVWYLHASQRAQSPAGQQFFFFLKIPGHQVAGLVVLCIIPVSELGQVFCYFFF
jgi:hypothetical protein